MSYKIVKDGLSIEVDSENEFKIALNILQEKTTPTKTTQGKVLDVQIPSALAQFWENMLPGTKQYDVLLALKANPNGLTASQLMEKLGITAGQALGGTMGSITKQAWKLGIEPGNVYKWNKEGHGEYKLTDEMLKAIKI